MDPIFELAITLPARGSRDLMTTLHRQIRTAILDGRIKPGVRLPSTRELSGVLGVSRNTTVAAYDLLLSEGYVNVRSGAGTYVAEIPLQSIRTSTSAVSTSVTDSRISSFWHDYLQLPSTALQPPWRFDFRIGLPDISAFPFPIWRQLSARALRELSKAPAAYSDPQGRLNLRATITAHVSFARAVACTEDDIVITGGTQQAFDLLARILVTPGQTTVAVEDPGYAPMRAAFTASGATIVTVPVDSEGLVVEQLPVETRVICVTPTHQFPLGYTMSARRRSALLDFAQKHSAVIIEDDYDSEFRYGGRPLDALQTLDRNGLVFYIGTFSKCLFPSMRLGFVVSPPWAKPALVAARKLSDWHSPIIEQDTLAAFIAEGHLARYIRKMRKVYGERRSLLIAAISRHCSDLLLPVSAESGLHLTALVTGTVQATEIAARASEIGIGIYPLSRYPMAGEKTNGLVFGFGMIKGDQIDEAIRCLAGLMRGAY